MNCEQCKNFEPVSIWGRICHAHDEWSMLHGNPEMMILPPTMYEEYQSSVLAMQAKCGWYKLRFRGARVYCYGGDRIVFA